MSETRSETAKFRVTPDELLKIDDLAFELKIKRSQLLRKLCLERKIVLYDFSKLDVLSYEIGKIGVNVNQIARKINQGGILEKDNAEFLLGSMELINTALTKLYTDLLENRNLDCEEI